MVATYNFGSVYTSGCSKYDGSGMALGRIRSCKK